MHPYFNVFGVNISAYATLILVAFIVCGYVFYLLLKKQVASVDMFLFGVYIFIGGIVGAKILAMIVSYSYIFAHQNFNLVLWILNSGMVFYGGVIGGFLMGSLYIKLYGLSPSVIWQAAVTVLPLGSAIGRVGCFLSGCCYGKETTSSCGVVFNNSLVQEINGLKVHATQLYEMYACIFIFIILLYLNKKENKDYFLFFCYTVLYGVARFVIELFRGDEVRGVFILSTSQIISIIIIVFGALLYYTNLKNFYLFKQTAPIIKPNK